MPPARVTCPNCRARVSADLPPEGGRVTCPACEAAFRVGPPTGAARRSAAAPPDDPDTPRRGRRRKSRPPAWALGLVGLVVLAGAGLVAAVVLSQRPGPPRPAPEVAAEAPAAPPAKTPPVAPPTLSGVGHP